MKHKSRKRNQKINRKWWCRLRGKEGGGGGEKEKRGQGGEEEKV